MMINVFKWEENDAGRCIGASKDPCRNVVIPSQQGKHVYTEEDAEAQEIPAMA